MIHYSTDLKFGKSQMAVIYNLFKSGTADIVENTGVICYTLAHKERTLLCNKMIKKEVGCPGGQL